MSKEVTAIIDQNVLFLSGVNVQRKKSLLILSSAGWKDKCKTATTVSIIVLLNFTAELRKKMVIKCINGKVVF